MLDGALTVLVNTVLSELAVREPELRVKPVPRQQVMVPKASRGVMVHVPVPLTRILEPVRPPEHETLDAAVGAPCWTVIDLLVDTTATPQVAV
jgi:hypothetical protein